MKYHYRRGLYHPFNPSWLIISLTTGLAIGITLYYLFNNLADILWNLSTPLVSLIGGRV